MFTFYYNPEQKLNLSTEEISQLTAISYLTDDSSYYQLEKPFAMNFITYYPKEDIPFRSAILAPDFAVYCSLNKKEFSKLVATRSFHFHNTYEFLFVLKGELYQNIEHIRHLYPTGSCCLMNRNIRHMEEYVTEFSIVNLSLSASYLSSLLSDLYMTIFDVEKGRNTSLDSFLRHEINSDNFSEKNYMDFIPTYCGSAAQEEMHYYFDKLVSHVLNPRLGSSLICGSLILAILSMIDNPQYYSTAPVQLGSKAEALLFSKITKYMEESDGRASRKELESALNYSGYYINQVVQKYTGLNLFNYGMTFCMKKAAWLLCHTTFSVSDISTQLHFSNRTHFYKVFSDYYHMTPKEYREKFS